MTPEQVRAVFTRKDGSYLFARWGRPIVPVVFGVDDATLVVFKAAIEAVVACGGHQIGDTDPELGANLMIFAFRDWGELPQVPNLDRLIPDLAALCDRLSSADASRYRAFRFDAEGRIKAAFVFLRIDAALGDLPADTLALHEAVQVILLWGEAAFAEVSPLALIDGVAVVRPEIAAVIRVAYGAALPSVAQDPSHAYRIAARLEQAIS